MTTLTEALARTSKKQRQALEWFLRHSGQSVRWADIQEYSSETVRLVTQAKGIYKPKNAAYAVSVRDTISSTYKDNAVERHEDGTWIYLYHQEGRLKGSEEEFTNRALLECKKDGVPVGVLIQSALLPESSYDVIGVGLVTDLVGTYFIIEGFSPEGEITNSKARSAKKMREGLAAQADTELPFDPSAQTDLRARKMASVYARQGQGKFRRDVIEAYSSRCAITDCDALGALDAAHIVPYRGPAFNHITNGLLLRADIHNLFDLGLIAVHPETLEIVTSTDLRETQYASLAGKNLREPDDIESRPSRRALASHRFWSAM